MHSVWVFRHRRRRFVLRRPRGETRGTAAESALVSLRGGGGGGLCVLRVKEGEWGGQSLRSRGQGSVVVDWSRAGGGSSDLTAVLLRLALIVASLPSVDRRTQ